MKKIIKVFPILILIVISILTVILEDMKEKELYRNVSGYHNTNFIIPENEEDITNEDIDKVIESAKSHNVVLIRVTYDDDNRSVDQYISSEDIFTLYRNQLNLKLKNTDSLLGITTYKDESTLYYPDFLNNDKYSFYPINMMKDRGIYRFGSYVAYYQNEEDYFKFKDEAKDILNVPMESLYNEYAGQHGEPFFFYNMVTVFCIAFFALFYFVLTVFLFYRDSKKTGILTLLGFDNIGILKNNLRNFSIRIVIASLILFILSLLFLPNIKLSILIKLIEIDVFILVLSIVLSYLALLFLQKYFSLSNILKKQSVVHKISNLCLICKFVMMSCMILLTIYFVPLIQESLHASRGLKDNKVLMDYAVFPRYRVENGEHNDYDKYLKLYQEILDSDIEHIYASFSDYSRKDKKFNEEANLSELSGKSYRIASVDKNYLNLYSVVCYDSNGNVIDPKNIDQEFYLLPMSKKDYRDGLKSYIEKRYEHNNINENVLIYYYENRLLDTFDSQDGDKTVDSPIIRVIHKNNPYTYIQNSYGLSIAGIGMNTALKFNVSGNDHVYQQLLPCIKKAGLEDVLVEENFVKYKDYYNEVMTRVHNSNMIFISGISFCLCVYVFIIFQTFSLFVDARKKEILVKSILGFNRKDIFKSVILWNIGATFIPISCALAYSITSRSNHLILILCACAIFFVLDLIILFIITGTMKLTKMYTELKGE